MTDQGQDALPWTSTASVQQFLEGVHSRAPVTGFTHAFYLYPARFCPRFARAAIAAFTRPGDLVLDPFMGGATTLVEAGAMGRNAIGLDISTLSCFVAGAKTTLLTDSDIRAAKVWTSRTIRMLNMRRRARRPREWIELGYQRNISTHDTWPIRKCLELALDRVSALDSERQQIFVRALLLRTAQWAFDCRTRVPSAGEFRDKIAIFLHEMIDGAKTYRAAVDSWRKIPERTAPRTLILNRSAEGIEDDRIVSACGPPKLVLTSPPYPGVHVMYHRWQVLGRRETPAPFWIADTVDGNGASYYTFGDRHRPGLKTYFQAAFATFSSLARIADSRTLFVQMVAFADPSWQLPEYLATMEAAGLTEVAVPTLANGQDGRLWRTVPNRRWYADQRGLGGASREVVLFHRRSR